MSLIPKNESERKFWELTVCIIFGLWLFPLEVNFKTVSVFLYTIVFSRDLYDTIAAWMFHKFFVKTRRSLSQDKISKLINYVFPCSYLLTSLPEALDWLQEVCLQDKFYFWEFMPQIQKDEVAVYELMVILWEWQIKDRVRKHFLPFFYIFDCEYLLAVHWWRRIV